MARRKDHTREELYGLAVEAARTLVREGGAGALTARAVAGRMGYSAGTLYNLFPDIAALAGAVNEASLRTFAGKLRGVCSETEAPEARLRRIVGAYLDFEAGDPQLWSLLFDSPLQGEAESYSEAVHAVFAPVVETLLPFAGGDPVAARREAKIVWATLHGLCLLRRRGKLDVGEADPTADLVEHFLRRYFSPESREQPKG